MSTRCLRLSQPGVPVWAIALASLPAAALFSPGYCAPAEHRAPAAVASPSVFSCAATAVMVDEDYFGAGASAELDKRVEGDALLAGARVAVRGPVRGDLGVVGGDLNVADTVGQDLYAAGGGVALTSQVAGNARVAGGQVTIAQRGGIGGKASIAAANLRVAGRIGRYLVAYAQSVRIDGEVGGDLRVVASSIELGPQARIGGRLIYRSPQPAQIDPAAVIAGGISYTPLIWPAEPVQPLAHLAAWVSAAVLVLSLLVVGAVMVVAFPGFSAGAAQTIATDPWKCLALGFALLLCIPAAAIVFMVTVIGVPLGLLLLLLYPALLLLGYLSGALFLADRLMRWSAKLPRAAKREGMAVRPAWRFAALATVLLILLLLIQVPFLGVPVTLLVLLLGMGAFWLRAYRSYGGMPQSNDPVRLDLAV
jgi:hypothetical protein